MSRQQRNEGGGYGSQGSGIFTDGSSNGDLAAGGGYPSLSHRRSPSSVANASSQDLMTDQNVPPHLVDAFATAQVGYLRLNINTAFVS